MAQNGPSTEEAKQHVERAARKASPWIERLARAGYVAYGVVYVLVGVLAIQAAFGGGGKTPSQWTTRSGRLGYAARGVVFGVIGIFLVQAALQTDPDEARGLGGALNTLVRQPFGPYILGAVAIGLVTYGVFMFVIARYRRIEPKLLNSPRSTSTPA